MPIPVRSDSASRQGSGRVPFAPHQRNLVVANALSGLTNQTARTRVIAAVVLLALLVGVAVQLATSAGAEGITITRSAAARDAMGVDYNRDGNAVNTKYHIADHTLSVGETPGDGHDARALLPFWITDDM